MWVLFTEDAPLVCSMTTTWVINRNITFADSRRHYSKWVEGAVYMAIMLIGAGVNFSIYAWLLVNNGLVKAFRPRGGSG